MTQKLSRLFGTYKRVPTLADDSGIVHAILFAVNDAYRAADLRDRCNIVLRFRQKLATLFQTKFPDFPTDEHADTFASNMRSYSGRITPAALRFIEIALKVNIALLHVPREKLIRKIDYDFVDTIVLAWADNWGVLVFADGSCILPPTHKGIVDRAL